MSQHRTYKSLEDATMQELQLEIIQRTLHNDFDGRHVYDYLIAHPDLWTAVLLDRNDLIKLRDLPENIWNADTLFILTPDASSAYRLAEVAQEQWSGLATVFSNKDAVDRELGGAEEGQAIVSIWWD